MRKVPEEKLLLKSELMRAGEREFQTNMAWKTPTKLVNTKIYVPVNSKTAHSPTPRAIPEHLTRVQLRTVGNLTQNEAPRWGI